MGIIERHSALGQRIHVGRLCLRMAHCPDPIAQVINGKEDHIW